MTFCVQVRSSLKACGRPRQLQVFLGDSLFQISSFSHNTELIHTLLRVCQRRKYLILFCPICGLWHSWRQVLSSFLDLFKCMGLNLEVLCPESYQRCKIRIGKVIPLFLLKLGYTTARHVDLFGSVRKQASLLQFSPPCLTTEQGLLWLVIFGQQYIEGMFVVCGVGFFFFIFFPLK